MNKYKKIAFAVVSTVMAGTMVFSLAACNKGGDEGTTNPPPEHTDHTAKAGWEKDASGHWHVCAEGGEMLGTKESHVWDNDQDTNCNVCGYVRTVTPPPEHTDHTAKAGWEKDASGHWHVCAEGGEMLGTKESHVWDNDQDTNCNVCGYVRTVTPPGPSGDDGEVKDEYGVLNDDGSLNYTAYEANAGVTLNLAVGHDSQYTSTSYYGFTGELKMADGNAYAGGNRDVMKPAWAQMGKELHITWHDNYQGKNTSSNLGDMTGTANYYANVDLFTSDLSKIVSAVADNTNVLNLGDYLDYMPNFAKFLNENPVVYLSLLQVGMDTTTGADKKLYVAPYFDGNDDIERYCIIRHDWVKKVLNSDTGITSTTAWTGNTSVEPFFTAGYEIESLNKAGDGKQTIKKDYEAAKSALADSGSDLAKAYAAIAGTSAYNGTGNIVDIMNKAIAADATKATGAALAKLYREYIDAAYKVGSNAAYAEAERANLFVGYDAAWDVDDLVAMLRILKLSSSEIVKSGNSFQGIAPRSGQRDRTSDIVSLAGQLYGVRGTTSKYEFTYIDGNGELQDGRNDKAFYQAMYNLHLLSEEGLVADYSDLGFDGTAGLSTKTKAESFMMYDYSQTQTQNGFYVEDAMIDGAPENLPDDFYFSPVMVPVSKWDVDADESNGNEKIMRFTESWRSTKTGGLAVNGAVANNPQKLRAALNFIDYLYSQDGQIISTYGPMASDAQGTGGFWYNEEASEGVTEGTFQYHGKTYIGTPYKDRYTPTLTENLQKSFRDKEVNGLKVSQLTGAKACKLNYTNYARQLIGSTLPVGVKDQSFENQLTSEMGQAGTDLVSKGFKLETVFGTSLNIDENNWWYTTVPTSLPIRSAYTDVMGGSTQETLRKLSGEDFGAGKNKYSIFNWIVLNGWDNASGYTYDGVNISYNSLDTLYTLMAGSSAQDNSGAQYRETIMRTGWTTAKEYWNYLNPNK